MSTSGPLGQAIVETCKACGIELEFGLLTEERLVAMVQALGRAATAESKLRAEIEKLAEDGEGYTPADSLWRALAGLGPRPPRRRKAR